MFSIFTHVMKPVGDINSEPGLPVFQDANLDATVRCRTYYSHVSIHPSTFDIDESKKLVVRNKGRNLLVYLGKVGKGFLRLYWGEGGHKLENLRNILETTPPLTRHFAQDKVRS